MNHTDWIAIAGHAITLLGVIVVMWIDRKAVEQRQQNRHEENIERLAKLEHLDRCVDDLKHELADFKDQVVKWMIGKTRRRL